MVSVSLSTSHGAQTVRLEEDRISFLSGGRKIKVDSYIPLGPHRYPAVLVLYGSGGAVVGKREMVDFARQLAREGAAVFLVHYLNRTGTLFVTQDGPIKQHWVAWTDTVRDAIDFVGSHPRVREGRVGLLGYSLGAYLAVAASSGNSQVGAVVEMAGGIFDEIRNKLKRLPPMLILHGRHDQRVPVNRAVELERAVKRLGSKAESHIYEAEGHRFSKDALADARRRGVEFMIRHLQ